MITRRMGRRHIIATALATLMLVCLTGCFATPFGRASIFEVFKPSHRREHQTPEQVQRERRERAWAIRRWTDERHALSLKIRDALRDHQRWPTHAAMLVADGYLEPDDFVLEGGLTDPSQIRVGHTDLATLPTLPLDERRAAAQAAADALPDDVVAHRLGDFVFMHQRCRAGGEELPARQRQVALSRLWSVVASPDPGFNPRGTPRHYWDLWERLRGWGPHVLEQNKRRGELGLAPIPQPRTVKHGKPATALTPLTPDSGNWTGTFGGRTLWIGLGGVANGGSVAKSACPISETDGPRLIRAYQTNQGFDARATHVRQGTCGSYREQEGCTGNNWVGQLVAMP